MYRHILVAHGSRAGNQSLGLGLELAKQYGARITVVYVIGWYPEFAVVAQYDSEITRNALGKHGSVILAACRERMHAEGLTGEAQMIQAQGWGMTVGCAVARFASEVDADLIVAGIRRSRWRLFREDVVGEILRYAHGSVVVAGRGYDCEVDVRSGSASIGSDLRGMVRNTVPN